MNEEMVDVHWTVNGCKVFLQHEDAAHALRTAGNVKALLAAADRTVTNNDNGKDS